VIHRDATLWEQPERFDPDRFLPECSKSRPKFAYFPFSGGRRKCIGDRFARMEAVLAFATLLRDVTLKPTPGKPVQTDPTVTLRAKHGIWLDLAQL
jgi:cytochrome P450